MKTQLIVIAGVLSVLTVSAQTNNVGIGTTSPGSKLSVNGSVSVAIKYIDSNYTLTADDYILVYNGVRSDTISLPPALPVGAGNFKGRIYKIKNNNLTRIIWIKAAGSELINGFQAILIAPGHTIEMVSSGILSDTTWEVVSYGKINLASDVIREAISAAGCTSCTSYDLAGNNTWIEITASEYNSILQNVGGAVPYGASSVSMANSVTNSWSGGYTITQNFSQQLPLPASSYPIALSVRTGIGIPLTMAGIKLKVSPTSQTSGYTDFPTTVTPNVSGSIALNTVYYFVLKKPNAKTADTGPSNLAVYTPETHQIGINDNAGISYYGSGDVSSPNNGIFNMVQLFQVIATPVRQW